jgi:hypothetical protein
LLGKTTYYKTGHQVVGFIYGFTGKDNTIYTRFRDLWDTLIHGYAKTDAKNSEQMPSPDSSFSDDGQRWTFPIDVNCIPGGSGGESLTTSHIEEIIKCQPEEVNKDVLYYWIFWVEAMCAAESLNLQFMFMVDKLQAISNFCTSEPFSKLRVGERYHRIRHQSDMFLHH